MKIIIEGSALDAVMRFIASKHTYMEAEQYIKALETGIDYEVFKKQEEDKKNETAKEEKLKLDKIREEIRREIKAEG